MTSRDFCFWLQGVFEVGGATRLDEKQTALVRQHLALVFKHEIDPSMGGADHQADLNEIHAGEPLPASLEEAIGKAAEAAVAKLPKPQFGGGRSDVILRC